MVRKPLLLSLGFLVLIATLGFAVPVPAQGFDPCVLLRNPADRDSLSGAFERKLMIQCGEITPQQLDRIRKGPGDLGPFEPWQGEGPGVDVRINNPAIDFGTGTTQSETSVVAVGSIVCAAWNDSGEFGGGGNGSFSGHGVSINGGATWADGGPFPNGPGPDHSFGDPSLAFSVKDNMFYYASLSNLGLSLWKSSNCQTFTYVGAIHVGGGDDKELMAVDNNPASPRFGRIYVGWTNFALGVNRNQVTHSDNGGLAWSAAVSLPGSGINGQGMWPAVAPNGDVFFALLNRAPAQGGLQDQWIFRSIDGGATWVKRTDIGTGQLRPERIAATNSCGRQALNGNIRNLSSPQIAIHKDAAAPAGFVIHATYPYDSDGGGVDNSNVFYKRSTDGAATWSAEVKLNDDATTTDQWFPAIGVNQRGVVVASWYDRRLDAANNLRFNRFSTISRNGGLSWEANVRLSDVDSGVPVLNPNFDPNVATCYMGDYDQIAVDKTTAHVVWSDNRRLAPGPNPDVYYDNIVFATTSKQVSALKGPETTPCAGPTVGKSIIKPLKNGGTRVKVRFTAGPPNTTSDVFWTCTNVANGCHADACGFINIGQVTTDAFGKGLLNVVLPNGNPFGGKFVHLDVIGSGGTFTSTFGKAPFVTQDAPGADNSLPGDPTRR
jgi:hypothetical protein